MKSLVDKVREFHIKQQFPVDLRLEDCKRNVDCSKYLKDTATNVLTISDQIESLLIEETDPRLLRAHLILEEACESILGLANCDEVELLDGLSDALYVDIGTAVTFNLPITEGLMEVCFSNLTKSPRDLDDPRVRVKGDNYKPPNLRRILDEFRKVKTDM